MSNQNSDTQPPQPEEPASNIEKLEKRVAKLENKKKDFWDIAGVIGGILMPLAIAWVGWEYSGQMKEAEIQSNARQLSIQNLQASQRQQSEHFQRDIDAKLRQAELVDTFFEKLVTGTQTSRELALAAIVHAMPSNDAERLLQSLQATVADAEMQQAVKDAKLEVEDRKKSSIENFTSRNFIERKAAIDYLIANYRNSPAIVADLLKSIANQSHNEDAANDALRFFAQMNPDALSNHTAEILNYAEKKRDVSPTTRRRIRDLAANLHCEGSATEPLDHNIAERNRVIPVVNELGISPIALNKTSATIRVTTLDDEPDIKLIDQFNMAPGETIAFPFDGSIYTLTLNWIDTQRFSGDLRINVNMTVTPCA